MKTQSLIAGLATAAIQLAITRKKKVFPDDTGAPMPGPAPQRRQFGNVGQIFRLGMLDAYERWSREFGGRDFVIWAGHTPHVVVSKPETVRHIIRHGELFVRDARPTAHLFGGSLIRLQGKAWRKRRNLFSPGFHPESLEHVVPVIQDEFAGLVSEWRGRTGKTFSPVRDISFRMLSVLGRSLFDYRFAREQPELRHLHRAMITLSTDPVFRHFLPKTVVDLYHLKQVRRSLKHMNELCREIRRASVSATTPFLSALREGAASGELDDATVIDELRTFLIAGHETSATALSWTLAMLALYPEVQEKVRQDVRDAGPITSFDQLYRLRYTTCVIRETMRLFPPVPISIYETTEATRISGHHVPAGTRVDLCSYVLHRNPLLWKDPEKFDPSRFESREQVSHFQYLPFLMGSHTCIGMRLAMAELPLAVAAIVSAFRLSAPEGPPLVNLRLSLHPAKFRLKLDPINSG